MISYDARVSQVAEMIAERGFMTAMPDLPFARKIVEVALGEEYCPYDCDSCHSEDCPCDRLGCAGNPL